MAFEYKAVEHEYWVDGVRYPSVTQILSGLGLTPDYSGLDTFYRDRGTAVHACIRMHLDGDEIDWDFEGADEVKPRFEKFLWVKEEYQLHEILYEEPMYSKLYGYAGTPDLVAWSGKLKALTGWDWKGNSCEPGHALQFEAYAELINGSHWKERLSDYRSNEILRCPAFIVTLGGSGKRPGVHPIDRSLNNREVFLAAVGVYNWRAQNVKEKWNGNGASGRKR